MRWINAALTVLFMLVGVERAAADFSNAGGSDLWAVDAEAQNLSTLVAAQAQIQAEQYQGAIVLLKAFVRAEPDNADGWNLLAFLLRKTGDFDAALEGYTKALELEPVHIGATEYLGELHLQLHDLEAAQKQLEALTELCPEGCAGWTALEQEIEAYQTARPAAGG